MGYSTNLLEFISKEENNLLTSLVNFHVDVGFFAKVDGLFKAPVDNVSVKSNDDNGRMLMGLYLFVHYHLYLSVATLLRCHLSDSLHSTRKAIDATLSAYKLKNEPETLNDYLNEHGSYRRITRTIERARKNDPDAYPLAAELLKLHGVCSQYGSHADVSSFAHRVRVVDGKNGQEIVEHSMFQYPEDPLEFRYYIVQTYSAYMHMLGIFADPIGSLAVGFPLEDWNREISVNHRRIEKESIKIAEQGKFHEKAEM